MPMNNATGRRRQLRDFLMARRAAVLPESVGLSAGRRRRTPGLRREELAALAGVSVTWYTWLEQGRDIRASLDTLERVAQALRLTDTDTRHLFLLAGVGRPDHPSNERSRELDQGIRGVLDAFHGPAFVVNPAWDVEAFNDIADRVYEFSNCDGPFSRNHIWRLFMDKKRRGLYVNLDVLAETAVGLLRTVYARRESDPYVERLIQSLIEGSPGFRVLWSAQRTAPLTPDRVQLRVPGLGEVHVTSVRLPVPGWDDYVLFLLPPADPKSADLMARLVARGEGRRRSRPAAAGLRSAGTRR
jgi:transcriptional regulator with XRE-family HTH domain